MRRSLGAILLVLACAATLRAADEPAPPNVAQPQWGRGPFEVGDPFILGELRSTWYARSPRVAKHLQLELGARGTWENSYGWGDDETRRDPFNPTRPLHRTTLDAETRGLDLVARIGLFDRAELGAELRALHWRGGGHLDRAVRQFHRSTGIGSLDREQRPNDAYLVAGGEPGGSSFDLRGRGTRLGDAALSARALVLEGGDYHPAITLGVKLWLPTASPGLDHADGFAETVSIDLSKRIADLPLILYAGAAYTYYDDCRIQGLHLERHRGSFYVGLEWEIVSRVSVVAHFFQETPRERRLWKNVGLRYGNFVQYVAAGLKVEPIDGLTIELGVLENVLDPNTTGDIGFLFNVWWRWDLAPEARAGAPAPK